MYDQRAGLPSPSLSPVSERIRVEIERIGNSPYFPAARTEEQFRRIGNGVHAYLAAMPSLAKVDTAARRVCASRCLARHGADEWVPAQWLVDTGDSFSRWIRRLWPHGEWRAEVPFVAERAAGGSWRGRADLLVWIEQDRVVLIDHKSTPVRREQCESQAIQHSGQIWAMNEAVQRLGVRVDAALVHFPFAGVAVRLMDGGY